MLPPRNADITKLLEQPVGADGRRHGRLRCQAITCSLGPVLDVSGGGMRVRTRGNPHLPLDIPVTVTIHAPVAHFTLSARAVWIKKVGLFQREIGLVFDNPAPEIRQQLALIARATTTNITISPTGI